MTRPRRAALRRAHPRARGQSVVELAVFLPLLLFFGLACIQFAIVTIAYINVMNVTRDAARWVSVHPHVIDSATTTTVKSRLPTSLVANNLSFTYTPACAALASGRCTGRDAGVQISVRSTYNAAPHVFLPATFRLGVWDFRIPTTLPNYTIFMQVEPT